MGFVYLAYDEQLDRKVAIKVLRPRVSSRAHARIEREAKVMAKVDHPNVLAVYDVGKDGEQFYIAMQYMPGETLEAWCNSPSRSWRDVLDAYRQAGGGLAAAHAAGLVHRDFKPQNVMVQQDETGGLDVKVLDFGLARQDQEAPVDPEILEVSSPDDEDDSGDSKLTAVGTVMGTPAYMAPEQFASGDVDAAADQFSFCVSLWEGLFGERPHTGDTVPSLFEAVAKGRIRKPPSGTEVPGWVTQALERGLAPKPSQRWPTMRELLDALTPAASSSGRWRLAGGVGIGVLGLTFGAQAWWSNRAERCTGAAEQLQSTWNEQRRDEIRSAILSTEAPFAKRTWNASAQALDAYAEHWMSMHTEACEATAIRGEQSTEVLDLRMGCLQRAEWALGAVVDTLAEADVGVVANADHVLGQLPQLEQCADIGALQRDEHHPQPHELETVNEAQALIVGAETRLAAGQYAQAEHEIDRALERLDGISYQPSQAHARQVRGKILLGLGRPDEAEETLEVAIEQASRTEHRKRTFAAAVDLIQAVGVAQRRFDAGLRYVPLARGLARTDEERARIARVHSSMLNLAGRLVEAEAEARRAIELGKDDLASVTARTALASSLRKQGKLVEAEEHLRKAAGLIEGKLGPLHPRFADVRNDIANVLGDAGRYDEAETEHLAVIEIRRAALGPDHPEVARSLNNIAMIYKAQDRLAEAEARYRTALSIKRKALGDAHPSVALTMNNLANLLRERGQLEAAESLYRQVLKQRARILPPDHPSLASTRSDLAILLLELDRAEEALALAELAWARRKEGDIPPGHRGNTAMAIARALWLLDREPQRARQMATRAREDFEQALPASAEELSEINDEMRARGLD